MKSSVLIPLLVMLIALVMPGCASSTGVVRTGPDTYMISRSEKGFKDGGAVKAGALAEANKFCTNQGKVMKVISSSQKDMVPFTSDAYAEVHFKALDPDDKEAKTPTNTGALSQRVFKGDEKYQTVKVEVEKTEMDAKPKDVYAEIEKLGALLKKGFITQEEFDRGEKEASKPIDA